MRSGSLLLKSEGDRYVEAPLVGTDVDLVVSGPTARARVTQIFHNPTDGWVEAVYVYPLPEGGAVDTLKMVIGERIVVGDIKERKKARELYEQAKAAGQKTALMEQERPNIFTNSVANIGPGETVVVQIEYQEPVHQSGDEFSLRAAAGRGAALQPDADRADRRPRRQRPRLGHSDRSGAGSRPHRAAGARSARARAGQSGQPSRCACRPAFALGEVKSHHHARQDRRRSPTTPASSSSPTGRCRPIATSS